MRHPDRIGIFGGGGGFASVFNPLIFTLYTKKRDRSDHMSHNHDDSQFIFNRHSMSHDLWDTLIPDVPLQTLSDHLTGAFSFFNPFMLWGIEDAFDFHAPPPSVSQSVP